MQPTITLSSTEAKYKGGAVAACEAMWLKRILKDMDISIKDPILLYYDNMSNIHLAQNPVFHTRTNHIKVCYRFIRECVLVGDVDLQYINTNLHTTDI